jgi:hypothetical protein
MIFKIFSLEKIWPKNLQVYIQLYGNIVFSRKTEARDHYIDQTEGSFLNGFLSLQKQYMPR